MLADVIGIYVNSLGEREFDAPFMALLRLYDFKDIHFVHGAFEFGKDFIAKRLEDGTQYQYVFQSKAGTSALRIGTSAGANRYASNEYALPS